MVYEYSTFFGEQKVGSEAANRRRSARLQRISALVRWGGKKFILFIHSLTITGICSFCTLALSLPPSSALSPYGTDKKVVFESKCLFLVCLSMVCAVHLLYDYVHSVQLNVLQQNIFAQKKNKLKNCFFSFCDRAMCANGLKY